MTFAVRGPLLSSSYLKKDLFQHHFNFVLYYPLYSVKILAHFKLLVLSKNYFNGLKWI